MNVGAPRACYIKQITSIMHYAIALCIGKKEEIKK